jgi:hypothetical protein
VKLAAILKSIGFTEEQVAEKLARVGPPDPQPREAAAEPEAKDHDTCPRKEGKPRSATLGRALTFCVGRGNCVSGFRPGQKLRMTTKEQPGLDLVQLTPVDLAALVNIVEEQRAGTGAVGTALLRRDGFPETSEEIAEAERLWRRVFAAIGVFPGCRVIQ